MTLCSAPNAEPRFRQLPHLSLYPSLHRTVAPDAVLPLNPVTPSAANAAPAWVFPQWIFP